MQKLAVKTQNRKGNEPKYKENLGFATIFTHTNDYISVDLYDGAGKTYKQREQEEIRIIYNDEELFKGSFLDLKEKLKTLTAADK